MDDAVRPLGPSDSGNFNVSYTQSICLVRHNDVTWLSILGIILISQILTSTALAVGRCQTPSDTQIAHTISH